jgi:hypothetical protein
VAAAPPFTVYFTPPGAPLVVKCTTAVKSRRQKNRLTPGWVCATIKTPSLESEEVGATLDQSLAPASSAFTCAYFEWAERSDRRPWYRMCAALESCGRAELGTQLCLACPFSTSAEDEDDSQPDEERGSSHGNLCKQ